MPPRKPKISGIHAQKPSGRYRYKEPCALCIEHLDLCIWRYVKGKRRATCEECRERKRTCSHNTDYVKEHPDLFLGNRIGDISDDSAGDTTSTPGPDDGSPRNLVDSSTLAEDSDDSESSTPHLFSPNAPADDSVSKATIKLQKLAVTRKKGKKRALDSESTPTTRSSPKPVVEDVTKKNPRMGRMMPMGGRRKPPPPPPHPKKARFSMATVKKPTHYGKNLPPERRHAFHIDYEDRENIRREMLGLCSPTPPSPSHCPGSPASAILDLDAPLSHFSPNLDNPLFGGPPGTSDDVDMPPQPPSMSATSEQGGASTDDQIPALSNPTVSGRIRVDDHAAESISTPAPLEALHTAAAAPTLRQDSIIQPLQVPDSEMRDDEQTRMISPLWTPQSPLYRDLAPSPAYNSQPVPFTSFVPSTYSSVAFDHPHIPLEQAEIPSQPLATQPPVGEEPEPTGSLSREATPTPTNPYPAEQMTRLYRLPGHFYPRTYEEGCEIRDNLVQDAVDDDYKAEYHFGVGGQYRARAEDSRRRAADMDHILRPGPWY